MFQIGDMVTIGPPFGEFFPGEHQITGISETGAYQIDGIDFDAVHLTLAGE